MWCLLYKYVNEEKQITKALYYGVLFNFKKKEDDKCL